MIKLSVARGIATLLLGLFCVVQPAAGPSVFAPSVAGPSVFAPSVVGPSVPGSGMPERGIAERGSAPAAALLRYELGKDGALRYRLLTDPEPYRPDEFPQFALSLRRFQIVTIGVFPFALLFSGLGYELGRFGYYSVRAGAPDGRYAPRLFGFDAGAEPFSNRERIGVVTAAVSLSVVVGVLDYLLGRRERAAEPDQTW